jgi:hypothetical protein
MHTHLEECLKSLSGLEEEASSIFKKLSEKQINWKPSPKSWSVAECMHHLLIVFSKYEASVEKGIAQASKANTNQAYKPTFLGRIFMSFVKPTYTIKTSAPSGLHPTQNTYSKDIIFEYFTYLERVRYFIQQAQQLTIDINAVKIPSSVSKLIKFSLGDYFRIEVWHNLRHFNQMLRVCNDPDFPKD